MYSRKSLSQFFLANKAYLQKISDAIDISPDIPILEIGPGRGALTDFLLQKPNPLICVEIDRDLCAFLEDKYDSLNIVQSDIRKFEIPDDIKELVLVGNIPYHISFEIIEYILENRARISNAYLTVQKEFAQKLCAKQNTKAYGFLTCFTNFYTNPKIRFNIPKGCFKPAPRVDSAFIEFEVLKEPKYEVKDEKGFIKFLRKIFTQRRKKISNVLKSIYPKEEVPSILKNLKIEENLRPENLSLKLLTDIYQSFLTFGVHDDKINPHKLWIRRLLDTYLSWLGLSLMIRRWSIMLLN